MSLAESAVNAKEPEIANVVRALEEEVVRCHSNVREVERAACRLGTGSLNKPEEAGDLKKDAPGNDMLEHRLRGLLRSVAALNNRVCDIREHMDGLY